MMAAKDVYYSPSKPSAFSTLLKLAAAAKSKSKHDIKSWLLKQDSYTLHRPVRTRFPRNPYTTTNVMDVWECDLMVMQSLRKYNDKYKYLLSVTDVFSKYLQIVPLRLKTGTALSSAFRSILAKYSKPVRRQPIWVRTDRGKEFLNRTFQAMLKKEGIHFKVCRDPYVKCAILKYTLRTIRDNLY